MHHALFVCGQNRLRSPTAEAVCSSMPGIVCASAGVHDSAEVPLEPELIEWAHTIYVMEASHRAKLVRRFRRHLGGKQIVVLGIPDEFAFMDPALVAILEKKLRPLLSKYLAPPHRTD